MQEGIRVKENVQEFREKGERECALNEQQEGRREECDAGEMQNRKRQHDRRLWRKPGSESEAVERKEEEEKF